VILHIDMDAFYASVEQLDNPWLRGKCVIVGGTSGRGVVAAASYEARKFGVRSAMPVFEARRRCPQGVFIHPRMHRYQEVSREVMSILRRFSPLVEPVSIDEAFVDLAGTERLHGSPAAAAAAMKEQVVQAVHLTCSVGVAPNRFLAKIASDFQKPDGLTVIPPEQVADFIDRLPIGKVPGIGPKTQVKVDRLGVRCLGDIRKFPESVLTAVFGAYGTRLLELARGIDPTPITPDAPGKSVSSECTLPEDTRDTAALTRCLLEQAEEVAAGLRAEGVKARTVVLKIKHADFTLVTRRTTFTPPTQSSKELYRQALRLFEAYRPAQRIRLIGLGATGFVPKEAPRQQGLFDDGKPTGDEWETVDRTVESIQKKFGDAAISRLTLKGE
jgi:DNA polymerase-4